MTDLIEQCPLPELAEALKPFIKPREEVTQIRSAIDNLLTEHVDNDNIPLSRVTLHVPQEPLDNTLDTPFTGVRRAFIRALLARQKAQAQYDALRAEINQQQEPFSTNSQPSTTQDEEHPVAQTVSLIRQRQRREKLLVIERTLDDLEKARQKSKYADPSELLDGASMRSRQPPPVQQNVDEYLNQAQSHVFDLQKAVLQAQSKVQSKDHVDVIQNSNAEDGKRAFALRQARDDLISWIENQLARLAEEEEHNMEDEPQQDVELPAVDEIKTTVQNLYEKYLTSRQQLVDVLSTKNLDDSSTINTDPETITSTGKTSNPTTVGLASTILPFISTLRSTAQDEAALMQHTSYIRRQIMAATSDTEQLITRLSDESHMVRPGTAGTGAWKEAARELRTVDSESIGSNLVTGMTSIEGAREILG